MPKRQALRKVETPVEIMGEGAYVQYRSLTVQEQRELMETAREYQATINKHLEEYASGNDLKVADLTEEDRTKAISTLDNAQELMNYTDRVYASRIIDWNWVNDKDEPLPIPANDWSVMTTLYSHEYEYISELLQPKGDTEKK